MAFYDLKKNERIKLVDDIKADIFNELKLSQHKKTIAYFADEDTYIRKSAYLFVGRIYFSKGSGGENKELQSTVIKLLDKLIAFLALITV